MTIGDNQFTDAAPQIHNPTTIAYKEVLSMDPSTTPQEVAVVSLGSGKAKSVNVGLRKATISPPDKSHEAMIYSSLNGQLFPYFRFDVTQGLEAIASDEWKEWKVSARRPNESTFSKIERITNEYLAQQDVFQSMEEAARILIEQRYLRSTSRSRKRAEGKTANVSNRAISIFPSQRNRNFIAREEILENIERKTFPGSRLALSGLGGIG